MPFASLLMKQKRFHSGMGHWGNVGRKLSQISWGNVDRKLSQMSWGNVDWKFSRMSWGNVDCKLSQISWGNVDRKLSQMSFIYLNGFACNVRSAVIFCHQCKFTFTFGQLVHRILCS